MMKFFILYDKDTGEIQGRLKTSSKALEELYPDKIPIDRDEHMKPLEKTHKVDIAHLRATGHKKLKDKNDKDDDKDDKKNKDGG